MSKLTNSSEVLFRQIHPNFLENGEPSSDRFRPSEKDLNKLSVDRSALTTAAQSHGLYTSNGRASAAVFGLSVGEFESEMISCHSDPVVGTDTAVENPAHALADYSAHTSQKQKLIAKKLKRLAVARGCLHPSAPNEA
ncbi:hypothetical protein [Aromatoleum buckelii]|uniref:Uncharacterized protein n=1 Tax=Aromatoleum buckelii TaxID=200254 RepID=A0ABX1N882_9RHOO|nr:hypothetical protein [Aromatoleum buckelii]MCK0510023.1 hypothetical protein [Aromatoleum buckelii]